MSKIQDQIVNAPFPDLRIVAVEQLLMHEHHDPQRSGPLVAKLKASESLINPPIVAPLAQAVGGKPPQPTDAEQFVVLDGANRTFAFNQLEYPHILVQVMDYAGPYMTLDVWGHVISDLAVEDLLTDLRRLPDLEVQEGERDNMDGMAACLLTGGKQYAIMHTSEDIHKRNHSLSEIVQIYERNAVLNRTTVRRFEEVLALFPKATGLMIFPPMLPDDVLTAARQRAYLPPGVTRHVVQGRAVQVHFPLSILRDPEMSTDEKNEMLDEWIQQRLAKRRVRYYAEATYQFAE